MIGSLLNIKPILRVDEEGRLVSYKKVISRKKALGELVKVVAEKIADKKHLIINHACCLEEANKVKDMLKEAIGVEAIVTDLTQVIGCHTGPGLIAVFFFGKEK